MLMTGAFGVIRSKDPKQNVVSRPADYVRPAASANTGPT